ncbi:protein FAM193A isoform X2 [Patella vulgata]|uniref:protein FAM193A isoform X2 n=1 Tax=Patella vulgata TaxID=6465 RepID=UPI0024A9F297|nr:protein FAM193A isoform X2 [Patella vulgata]
MSTSESKKTKRRKIKNAVTKSSASSNVSFSTNGLLQTPSQNHLGLSEGKEVKEKLEQLIDSNDDLHSLPSPFFHRGPNPFMKERCLLCDCERIDPPEADKIKSESEDTKNTESDAVPKLPLWVCPACRKAADSEYMNKKDPDIPFLDEDLQPETIPFPFLPDINLDTNEPVTENGSICHCESCKERRQISDEYNKETQELQKCWVELRKVVQTLYESDDPYLTEADSIQMRDLVVKLCSRDPHQLFLRLESQVRDFVLEKKVRVVQQLNKGFTTLSEAQTFIHMLLEEYGQLCRAARLASECLADLKDHLKRFQVTWELHNKHLFQNIVYSYPAIHHNLPAIRDTLRKGVAEETCDDSYPNLLCRFLKYQDEMSVILAVWRDCQLLIENYNEEQTALKVKQKWLKEDWEFFKAQRKLLEQQMLKNPKAAQSTTSHNMEAQFTETMRNLLQGTRPSVEDCHCPRCNRKRCPCDECTITHMITCGIINPDALENNSTSHTFNFPHDPNFPPDSSDYYLNVRPPSVSSTNSSSGSASPIMVDPERLVNPFGNCPEDFETADDIPDEIVDDSQSDDSDDELDDEEDDELDDDEEDDDDDGSDGFDVGKKTFEEALTKTTGTTHGDLQAWMADQPEDCDCHHCVQPKPEEIFQEPYPCQCHLCLQQPSGHLLNTALPQHDPMSTRPTDLHIYPHIHGYPGLHGLHGLQGRNHVRSILQPQLYDLHNPLRQTKLPGKIDFDSPGSMQEHLYPAFGDWDNDPHGFLGSHQYGGTFPTDLLPPPPLTANNPFITDPTLLSSQQTPPASASTSSAFKTVPHSHAPNSDISCSSAYDVVHFDSCAKTNNSCSATSSQVTAGNKNQGPPCTRPVTLGGNSNTTPISTCTEKNHSQHCLKHNHQLDKSSSSSRNQSRNTLHNQHATPDLLQNNVKHSVKDDVPGKSRNTAPNSGGTSVPHSCSYGNKGHKQVAHQSCLENHQMTCQNAVSLPTSINNVSVGTSTLCTYPDCEGNHDDNCDSIDDTCSDKSSSTSSNQKEGKYCDCCYCEFFGHGNPVSQTSKKYTEMKERLRRRLKHRSEARPEDVACYNHGCHMSKQRDEKNEHKGLEELINFINGVDTKPKTSLKKQRQKQRKAEEKAKQEEKEERKRRKAERKLRKKLTSTGKLEYVERTETLESRESPILKKIIRKVPKGSSVETCTTTTATPSSANQPVPSSKEPASTKGHSSKLKEDTNRKSTSSPTTPIREAKEPKSASRPQTPKQSANNQSRKGQKLTKNDSRESPVPDQQVKNTPVGKTDQSNKSVQSNPKNSTSNKVTPNNAEVNKTSSGSNHPKLGQIQNNKSIPKQELKPAVIDPSQSKSSPRDGKLANSSGKKKAEATLQVKQNGSLPNQSPRQVQQSVKPSQEIAQVTKQPSSHTIKSKKKDVKAPTNGLIPAVNGDISNAQKIQLKATGPVNGLTVTVDKKNAEPVKSGKNKNKKKKKKSKSDEFDEIFLPRSESDIENGELDDMEKEIEDFKRFCLDSPQPPVREKMQVNINLKDILTKKKLGLGCS